MSTESMQIRISGQPNADGLLPIESAGHTFKGEFVIDEQRNVNVPDSAASDERLRKFGPVAAGAPPEGRPRYGEGWGKILNLPPRAQTPDIKPTVDKIDSAINNYGLAA